jgi:hypothetical protein
MVGVRLLDRNYAGGSNNVLLGDVCGSFRAWENEEFARRDIRPGCERESKVLVKDFPLRLLSV